jgi:hypothetical protein
LTVTASVGALSSVRVKVRSLAPLLPSVTEGASAVSAKVGKNHKFMIFNPFLGLIDRLFLSLFVIYTKIDKN